MKKPSVFLRLGRNNSLAASVLACSIAALLATQSVRADNAVWDGLAANGLWSDVGNWGNPVAVPGTLNTATFNGAGNDYVLIDTTGGVAIKSILFDTNLAAAYTIANQGAIALDSGGDITMTSTVANDQAINANITLNGSNILNSDSASNKLTVSGGITGGNNSLTKSGQGTLVLTGVNNTNTSQSAWGGTITIQGGVSDSVRSTLRISGGSTATGGGADYTNGLGRANGRVFVGTATSGYNTLYLDGGQLFSSGIVLGAGAGGPGYNTAYVSTPGTSAIPSTGACCRDGAWFVGVDADYNSMTVSNGAYLKQWGSGGTTNSYIGQYAGSDHNTMTITGTGSTLSHSGQRLYVGGDGSYNSLLVEKGGQVTSLRILHVGGNSAAASYNQATVTNPISALNASQQLYIGLTANSVGNSLLISDGAVFNGSINGAGRCIIGAAAGANSNSITVTGTTVVDTTVYRSTLNISTAIATAQLTLACNSSDASVAADSNELNVESGALANLGIPVKLGGTNSKFNLGDGVGTSTANIGSAASSLPYLVNLSVADAQLNINGGKLVALVTGKALVSGPGTVHLNGPATIDTGSNTNTIESVISGAGSLTKLGVGGTLTLASGTNTYSGNTNVNEGILELTSANPNNDSAGVTIDTNAAQLYLNFSGTDNITSLVINGYTMPDGVYGASTTLPPEIPTNPIIGDGTLTVGAAVLTPYQSWAQTKITTIDPSADATPGGDADDDGASNLSEFAFNGDPLSGSDNGKIYLLTADNDTSKKLILTVAVRADTPVFSADNSPTATNTGDSLTYTIQGSTSLIDGFLAKVNVLGTEVIPAEDPTAGTGYEYRSFSLDGSEGLLTKGFLRAMVTTP